MFHRSRAALLKRIVFIIMQPKKLEKVRLLRGTCVERCNGMIDFGTWRSVAKRNGSEEREQDE